MSSVHNPSTSSEKVIIEDGKDRISELPDAILIHILSFLPTKSVVATSLISPRWRNLWASVPFLDFVDVSQREYWNVVYVHMPVRVRYGLMNFVDKVLLLHDFSSISKFRLQCRGRIDLSRLHAWLMNLVHHLIKEIDINIPSDNGCVYLPQSFCTSKTLVVLRLGYRLRIQLPSSVWFPSLKFLEISLLHPENNMIQKLLSSCPILEDLIVGIALPEAGKMVLNIAISTLKRLDLNLHPETIDYHDCKIMLDTPSLENLSLVDEYLVCYSVKNMSSLVEASVYIGGRWSMAMGETKVHANCIYDILKGLSTVKSLSLFCCTMDVLDVADDRNLPMFNNLIHMYMPIHFQFHTGWPVLLKLFKSMPNLERLELALEYPDEDDVDVNDEKFIALESQEVPSCLLSHLKEIKVSEFVWWKDEMNLVKYLLENAKVLEKITIVSIDSSQYIYAKERKLPKKLLSFPKGSKTCLIKFA